MTPHRTARWNVALVAGLLTSATGVLLVEPPLLLVSIPAIVFAAYAHLTRVPAVTLALERSVEAPAPSHGQAVDVTVTLRNTGERPLSDLRIVDGVPPMLAVRDGAARHAAVLAPGDETTFSYTVVAKHGVHHFEPSTVVVRDRSASAQLETTVADDTELVCRSPIRTLPFDQVARRQTGTATPTDGKSGTAFSKIQPYQPGDPPSRIDWNRYARLGELTTVSFHEHSTRSTVLCLDARSACYRSAGTAEPHAVVYERAMAREVLDAAIESGERIGLAIVGNEFTWVGPRTGSHHGATIRRTLEDPATLPLEPPDRRSSQEPNAQHVRALRKRLGRRTGVVVLSPVVDEFPLELARTLRADGQPVTLLSPDVTASDSPGTATARLRRENRLNVLRRAGIPVVDWDPETPLETAIRRNHER